MAAKAASWGRVRSGTERLNLRARENMANVGNLVENGADEGIAGSELMHKVDFFVAVGIELLWLNEAKPILE